MPDKKTIRRARRAKRQGKSPSTQAGEFVREEIHHVREGEHGARSPEQVIAIGLSKARAAGVPVPDRRGRKPKSRGTPRTRPSAKRSRAALRALKHEPHGATSHAALAGHARRAAKKGSTRRRRSTRKR